MRRTGVPLFIAAALVGLAAVATRSQPAPSVQSGDLACVIMRGDRESAAERPSPLDSVSFQVAGGEVKVCYGRPSVRGRKIFGGEIVPFDEIWRTGANEPTMIHTSVPLAIGDVRVEPGTYSLYSVPSESEWQIIVNASVDQWGRENYYTEEVAAQEVGRVTVPAERTGDLIETFTIRTAPSSDGTVSLVLEWERMRVAVPISGAD